MPYENTTAIGRGCSRKSGRKAVRPASFGPRGAVLNEQTLDFFRGTLATLDDAFLRPRWPGYMTFQDLIGPELHRFVLGKCTRQELADCLEAARMTSQEVRMSLERDRTA